MLIIFKFLIFAYVAWLVIGYFLHSYLIFPKHTIDPPPPVALGPHVEKLFRPTERGEVEAWFFRHPTPVGLMILTHGNASLIDLQVPYADRFYEMGFHVLIPEYRGYGRSSGIPSQANIKDDILYFYKQVNDDIGQDKLPLFLVGYSLGGGVALSLVDKLKPASMLLHYTFTSVTAFTRKKLLPDFVITSKFNNLSAIKKLDIPIFIAHGERDTVVPYEHGLKLKAAAKDVTFYSTLAGHSDFEFDQTYWDKVSEFIRRSARPLNR